MLNVLLDYLNEFPRRVRSSDPVLEVLARDPSAILGRRFAGYCLFLFGAADEQFATWFTRNLISLDSLTGSEIACVVIAARVKVKVDRQSWDERIDELSIGKQTPSREIQLKDIDQQRVRTERLVSDGTPMWTGTTTEITAVTYGTDALAKQFGIVDELPCLVVLDAIPSKSFEILRLTDYAVDSLISLMREVISRFQTHEHDRFFDMLSVVEQLEYKSRNLRQKLDQLQSELTKMNSTNIGIGLPNDRADCLGALVDGNLRGFETAVNSAWDLQPGQRWIVLQEIPPVAPELLQNSKTVANLHYFSGLDIWPLREPWRSRVHAIYDRYARKRLPEWLQTPNDSRDFCLSVLNALQSRQQELAVQVMASFPTVEDRLMSRRSEHDRKCLTIERDIEILRREFENAESESQQNIDNLLSGEYPSLKDAFRDTARRRKLATARKTAKEAVFNVGTGLLKPETLLKIVETFHK